MFYRRKLPHWIPTDAIVFVTWRLAESAPPEQGRRSHCWVQSGSGPFWLLNAGIAAMLTDALRYGEATRQFYRLYAWVIMPNHVHVILQPRIELSAVMRWLKGRTSRMANRMLGRTGTAFWQDESFDHWIRCSQELAELIEYIESNPVKAGLVEAASEWPWSSAGERQTTKGDRLPHILD